MNHIQEIIEHNIQQLPPLPESVIKIESIYRDPDSSFKDMVVIIEKDPLLTAEILKAANSPLYGFSREINNLSQAVSLFGMGTVRGFVLSSIIKKSFTLDLSPYEMTPSQFSQLSTMQHALMTQWCKREGKLLGILSPAAFLVEIGKVLIAQALIAENRSGDFAQKRKELMDVEAAENECCHLTAPDISAMIFAHWRFEEGLIDTIKHCTHPDTAPESFKRASRILHVVRVAIPINGTITEKSIEAARALVETYGLDLEGFNKALESIHE